MSDDSKDNSVVLSWLDFPGSINTDKEDPASLLKPLSESERKTVYERLNQPLAPNVANSTMFIMLSEDSSDPHFIKDSSFKYIYANKAMADLFKRPVKDIIGLKDEQLFSPEEVGPLVSATCRTLRGRIVREKNTRTIDGVPRTFIDTLVPWRSDSGEIVAIYGTSVDVTDQTERLSTLDMNDAESRSAVMQDTLLQARLVAKVDVTVLLTGESGAGKDYLAHYIHDHSNRRNGTFESINCANLTDTLIESELFGYEKGAHSHANTTKKGLVELADGGTLFLDEIGELPFALQAKLLTFIEGKPFRRLGGLKDIAVDVRILAATNRDLEEEIHAKNFRFDLYHRINVWPIRVPSLRERMEDIPILVKSLMKDILKELKIKKPMPIAPSLFSALGSYRWPGNVRELRNVLERAIVVATANGVPLDSRCVVLPITRDESVNRPQTPHINNAPGKKPEKPTDEELLGLFEDYIVGQGWTRARLAKELLGVDESTAKKWLKAAGAPAGKKGRRPKAAPPIEN
jgi:PAS domain S-box-containing protein